jgi:hypothetical protein
MALQTEVNLVIATEFQTSRKLKKTVRHSVWQTMKICRTETKSVGPNKIDQNQRKTCVCISKTLFVFYFFAVKIGTIRTAHYIYSLSYTNDSWFCSHFSLNFVSGLFFSSFYCCSAHSSDVDFRFFPGLAPLATPCCIHAAWIKAGQSDRSGIKNCRTWSKFIGHVRRTDVFREVWSLLYFFLGNGVSEVWSFRQLEGLIGLSQTIWIHC